MILPQTNGLPSLRTGAARPAGSRHARADRFGAVIRVSALWRVVVPVPPAELSDTTASARLWWRSRRCGPRMRRGHPLLGCCPGRRQLPFEHVRDRRMHRRQSANARAASTEPSKRPPYPRPRGSTGPAVAASDVPGPGRCVPGSARQGPLKVIAPRGDELHRAGGTPGQDAGRPAAAHG